ncbi:MAG: BREX system serine/threonine kinase PglW [Acidobacteriota bacterium]|nr:BREX system serine/threonine kinase PglW [Acidobacteriota bacterium]
MKHWTPVTHSDHAHEQRALDNLKQEFDRRLPYYAAWSNVWFRGNDGSTNEVDLICATPAGFFIIEIKDWRGRLTGNQTNWTFKTDRLWFQNNPLPLCDLKCKRLAAIIREHWRERRLPRIQPLIFLSHAEAVIELDDCNAQGVFDSGHHGRQGLVDFLARPPSSGYHGYSSGLDLPTVRRIYATCKKLGFEAARSTRSVGAYNLLKVIEDGADYQDWHAVNKENGLHRRIRVYRVRRLPRERAELVRKAARNESRILVDIRHDGILTCFDMSESEQEPALIFDHLPDGITLEQYVRQNADSLTLDNRVALLRQVVDIMRFAHEKKLFHRALSPRNILVENPGEQRPRLKIYNWRTAHIGGTGAGPSSGLTSHLDDLLDAASRVYLFPEADTADDPDDARPDVFAMGTLAWFLFTGEAPADSPENLVAALRDGEGLSLAAVLDGVDEERAYFVQIFTDPSLNNAHLTMDDVHEALSDIESKLNQTGEDRINPTEARPNDLLRGGFRVKKRLGSGSGSVVLLVERDNVETVLKIAAQTGYNDRIDREHAVLLKLHHQNIIEPGDPLDIGPYRALPLQHADQGTLSAYLHNHGRLRLKLLDPFGEQLLQAADHVEEEGYYHRDIKPDNIGIISVGKKNKQRLILFDFSLADEPSENYKAGTRGYLDPFLREQGRRRYDPAAERYAAAVTLYQMASGALPRWGDGKTDPLLLKDPVTIRAELFDPAVREGLREFFTRALARDHKQRFDTFTDMLRQWKRIFLLADPRYAVEDEQKPAETDLVVDRNTPLALLLSPRALNALEQVQALTVGDLLSIPRRDLGRLSGISTKTRTQILNTARVLSKKLGAVPTTTHAGAMTEDKNVVLGIDLLVERLVPNKPNARREYQAQTAFLGLPTGPGEKLPRDPNPSVADLAETRDLSRAELESFLAKARRRWRRDPSLTKLRDDIAAFLESQDGLMTFTELADTVLLRRGCSAEEPLRHRYAGAVTRAALEGEFDNQVPRWRLSRTDGAVLVSLMADSMTESQLENRTAYFLRLGAEADDIAENYPPLAPARVLERLRAVTPPDHMKPLSENRLWQLAAATSKKAALSPRLELYLKKMPAERALTLAQGALLGARQLKPNELIERVKARYPEAKQLPEGSQLTNLLRDTQSGFEWSENSGAYVPSRQFSLTRRSSTTRNGPAAIPDRVLLDNAQFDRRLDNAHAEGCFLALCTAPRDLDDVRRVLTRIYPLDVVDLDALFLKEMQTLAAEEDIPWEAFEEVDAAGPQGPEWSDLQEAVDRAMPTLAEELDDRERTVLLVNAGLLARYGRMGWLETRRERTGRPDGPKGLWLLLPGDDQGSGPQLNGTPVPVITSAQWARVPHTWLSTRLNTLKSHGATP